MADEFNPEQVLEIKNNILAMLHRVRIENGNQNREKPVLCRLSNGVWQFVCTMAHLGYPNNFELFRFCHSDIDCIRQQIREKMKK